jgi:hypothetical protein
VHKLTPSQKGAAAEAAITARAIELGLVVLRPLCEGGRYDLIIDLDPELLRVQCKWARYLNGVLAVELNTSRCTPVDTCAPRIRRRRSRVRRVLGQPGRYFLIPIADVTEGRGIRLRLDPARNNQAKRIRWASAYDFDAMIARRRASQSACPHRRGTLRS